MEFTIITLGFVCVFLILKLIEKELKLRGLIDNVAGVLDKLTEVIQLQKEQGDICLKLIDRCEHEIKGCDNEDVRFTNQQILDIITNTIDKQQHKKITNGAKEVCLMIKSYVQRWSD